MALLDKFFGKVLYFPGCTLKFEAKDIQQHHEALLKKFRIKYVTLPQLEVCCGKPALDYGYKEDFHALRSRNTQNFQGQKIKKIITSCPSCYIIFKHHYEDIEVEHITETILNNLDKIDKKYPGQLITFYDSCNPQKDPELYENPRKILTALGFRLQELPFNKDKSLCCGNALQLVSPKISASMAKAVLTSVETRKVVTISPECYIHFKRNKKQDIRVVELSEVLL